MKIGIIGAIEAEISLYLDKLENRRDSEFIKRTFHEGTFLGKEVVIVAAGMGQVNAASGAMALVNNYKADFIIVSGVAGGIDKSLHIGDTVIADKVCYHDLDAMVFEDHPKVSGGYFIPDEKISSILFETPEKHTGKVVKGTIVTGDVFIEQEGREDIIKRFAPMCTDMETAAIAHICNLCDVPFAAVRSMSDTEEESGHNAFETNCKKASESSYLTVENMFMKI